MPTECNSGSLTFQAAGGRKCVASFDGCTMSSDAGVLLLGETERRSGILAAFSRCFLDQRDPMRTEHSVEQLVKQRIYGIALGYEDLNDHDQLRKDPLLAVVSGSGDPEGKNRTRKRDLGNALAGKSTLNRLELAPAKSGEHDRYSRITPVEPLMDHFMVSTFLKAHSVRPREIVLDVDSTDDPLHGNQEGRYFQGYYGHYCYLPLYIFSGQHILLSRLLPGNADPRAHLLPELQRIVAQIREQWPRVRIIVRGDSGFMSNQIMSYCEENGIDFVFGMAKNPRLVKRIEGSLLSSRTLCSASAWASR